MRFRAALALLTTVLLLTLSCAASACAASCAAAALGGRCTGHSASVMGMREGAVGNASGRAMEGMARHVTASGGGALAFSSVVMPAAHACLDHVCRQAAALAGGESRVAAALSATQIIFGVSHGMAAPAAQPRLFSAALSATQSPHGAASRTVLRI
jgi:hypothetical protein